MAGAPAASSIDAALACLDKALKQIDAISTGNVAASATTTAAAASASSTVEEPSSSAATATRDLDLSSTTDQSTALPRKFPEDLESFHKCDIRVGKVLSVEDHPVAEKLFVCKVEVAPDEARQVVAGLRKFMSASDLSNRLVCVVCNLKPAKLAGQPSEAMILAGSCKNEEGEEIVKLLEPSESTPVGTRVSPQGLVSIIPPPKQISSKVWEKVVKLLAVKGGKATYDDVPLSTDAYHDVKVPELPDGSEIH